MPEPASQSRVRCFVSDCEGPISKNDNAFEIAAHFLPEGDRFYSLVSRYDDVLADVVKKPGYKAGDTLRLILPFLKAYGVTDRQMREYSERNVLLVPGAKDTLTYVRKVMPSYIISTSYEHYISALCSITGFPLENTYCTRLNLDKYHIPSEETQRLRMLQKEIASLPMIEIPPNCNSPAEFSEKDQTTIRRLDTIFWQEIAEMQVGRMLREVNPVGGQEKAKALHHIVEKLNCRLEDVMYVGDSITDVQPLRLAREHGGLAVSFNGNDYAVREAEIVVLSGNTAVTSVIAEVFKMGGKEAVIRLIEEWGPNALKKCGISPQLREAVSSLFPDGFPVVERVTAENMERLKRLSSAFRKTVRGDAIGKLG